jgi:predicted RNase H-like HicB family nuclease
MVRFALVYLADLKDPYLRLKRAIPVSISYEEDDIIAAYNEELGVYVCGRTIEEALEEFRKAIVSDYEVYARSDPQTLTEGARELAERLRELIEETPLTSLSANSGEFFFWKEGRGVDTVTFG